MTDQDLLEYSKTNHSEIVIKSISDYQAYCKDNPECNFDEIAITQQKIFSLCSRYANTGYRGGHNQFLFPVSGNLEALLVRYDGGGGDSGTLHGVQYIR